MDYLCTRMRIFAYILLLGFILQTCSKQLIYTDYLVNKDFIASVLCINKNSPEKHCEGKCHLKKQLDQDTKQQEGTGQKSKVAGEVVFLSPESIVLEVTAIQIATPYFYYLSRTTNSHTNSVFQPPCAA